MLLQVFVTLLSIFTAVHEHVVFAGVGVEVAVEDDSHVVLDQFGDQLLDVEDAGVDRGDAVLVLSVEVAAGQVTPGVANDHAVRVQHRDNLEDEQPPQALRGLSVASEVMEDSWF